MKKLVLALLFIPLISSAQLKDLLKTATDKVATISGTSSGLDIAAGLKEALNKGVTEQVSKLTKADGFYKNEAVKIIMPAELAKVDNALRKMGMSSLADDGIKALNRAAEDAVKEATPIFVTAIKDMSITDAKGILLGAKNSATSYLQSNTTTALYSKFNPVVQTSIGKVGADVVWGNIITKYNALPFVSKVNPDITDYVTNKALDGVFKMITAEEKNIRTNLNSRTSDVLKKVFALQDKK
ncbi:DUF4197 domain-containing protein [Flavobacterium muglaense]|uniref:DUF4197 domain-containing protein n=1 Tax=Flavobacterium muglaense TaxID=2764716 RepID=A0A923N1V2_9FLAO|nr:DUF4197 domain-containing protein [Flavobacterium muglaense]MBC5839272.1 DUF4197 domain-containing protein [Flavobacterium muglaense]MBC5845784.1 DUF4197 domain-containing protein [Flavobacterium muglaense]